MTLKEIALELLERYRIVREFAIDRFSDDESQDLADLETKIEDYKKRIEEAPAEDWIPFRLREMTEEERVYHPGEKFMWSDPLPDVEQAILVSDGENVWEDVFCDDGEFCYLENHDYLTEGMAWMPKPKPYQAKEKI
jgi:hypothetical protein